MGWLANHDLPNWFTLIFSLIIWPVLLYGWSRRKVQGVRNLSVALKSGTITIDGNPQKAVDFEFHNGTGSVVYLRGLTLHSRTDLYPVPTATSRDMSTGASILKFWNQQSELYDRLECTLQTNERGRTTMPTTVALHPVFFHFQPSRWRQILRLPKYFVFEYTAMVGEKKYNVRTVY